MVVLFSSKMEDSKEAGRQQIRAGDTCGEIEDGVSPLKVERRSLALFDDCALKIPSRWRIVCMPPGKVSRVSSRKP